jgi:hypothetical protein
MSDTTLIDRKPAIAMFMSMFDSAPNKRVLRVTGLEKMGKSRVLREYFRIAREQWRAQCTLSDLRSKLQSCDDILFSITEQIGAVYFPNYQAIQNNPVSPKIDIRGVGQLLSILNVTNVQNKDAEEQYRRRITSAFIKDLRCMPANIPIVLLFDAFEEANIQLQHWINEQLISGLIQLPNVYIVLAGRNLPEAPQTWLDTCQSYDLPPVRFEDQKEYCLLNGISLDDDVIFAFHEAFDGKPGLFAEYTVKFHVDAFNGTNQ